MSIDCSTVEVDLVLVVAVVVFEANVERLNAVVVIVVVVDNYHYSQLVDVSY